MVVVDGIIGRSFEKRVNSSGIGFDAFFLDYFLVRGGTWNLGGLLLTFALVVALTGIGLVVLVPAVAPRPIANYL